MNKLPIINKQEAEVRTLEIPTPFPIGPINLYIILGDKITLVDTGPKTEIAWKSLVYQFNKNGIRIKDIDQVILTHHHVDHGGLLSVLLEHHPKLKIYAHEMTVPWLEKNEYFIKRYSLFYKELYAAHGLSKAEIKEVIKYYLYLEQFMEKAKVDGILSEGDLPEGLADWQVVHNPGHTQGHISLYNENTQTIIAGDHLIGNVYSGAFIEPPLEEHQAKPKSLVDYKSSLEALKTLKISQVFSGHGEIITDVNGAVDQQLAKIDLRINRVNSLLKEKPLSVVELMKQLYPNKYQEHLPIFFSEILSTLEYLEHQQKVSAVQDKELIKYQLV